MPEPRPYPVIDEQAESICEALYYYIWQNVPGPERDTLLTQLAHIIISAAFSWDESPQGTRYWNQVYVNLEAHARGLYQRIREVPYYE